jgi:hypothetical protein
VKREQRKRFYEVSAQDLVDFAGEDPLGFEFLRTQHAEAYAPDGLDEESCIYQMAKSLFLKRDLPTKRTRMKGFAEAETLDKFNDLLLAEASESEIQSALDSLRGVLIEFLRKHYPRRNYDSTEAWIEALKRVIFDELMPRAIEIRHQEEQQLQEPAPGGLVPEMLERELACEKQLDESYDRALNRLFKIKAFKRQITFRELQQFDRTHSDRVTAVVDRESD